MACLPASLLLFSSHSVYGAPASTPVPVLAHDHNRVLWSFVRYLYTLWMPHKVPTMHLLCFAGTPTTLLNTGRRPFGSGGQAVCLGEDVREDGEYARGGQ